MGARVGREEGWLATIEANAHCRLEDIANVRVGVKTTADNVFIRNDWDSIGDSQPEQKWIMPLISSEDAERWTVREGSKTRILYPYYSENGKRRVASLEDYPRLKRYLELHYEQLASRAYVAKANRKWYEIWVPQDPSAWAKPKIVFPDISSHARFLVDKSGAVVDGNCYWIQAKGNAQDLLYLIVAVANSSIMEKYHALAFQNVLYSGKRRYLTQYVGKYPIPDPDSTASAELIDYVKTTMDRHGAIDNDHVDSLVAQAFLIDG